MKKLLVGINSKFIHSNLAIRYIQKYGEGVGMTIHIAEYTINQSCDYILEEIVNQEPDVIGFSCYLWNIDYIVRLSKVLKKVLPKVQIIYGGPEVSYDSSHWIETLPQVTYVVRGEGEKSMIALLSYIEDKKPRSDEAQKELLQNLEGITYRLGDKAVSNPQGLPMSMAEVPFVYDSDMEGLDHRIIYYETSRGCPYSCEYCLSSIEKGVRFRPLDMVYKELQFFLDQKIMQVKFVDRTFNADKDHAMGIWQYLKDHDNGYTNFHFEMTADLIDDEMIALMKSLRVGLVQFEVGVQSTNEATIIDMHRKTNFDLLKSHVIKIKNAHNIHLHLDLIAGLPKEDYTAFGKSFNDVMAMRPEQLQLGFLKVLKGSMIYIKREAYGIVYRDYAPYEVLCTKEMTYKDLSRLKRIEALLEFYYNSGQFNQSVEYMMQSHETPFRFYEALAEFWQEKGYFHLKHTRVKMYDLLYEYGNQVPSIDQEFFKSLILHDLCSKEKPKKWPDFAIRPEGTGNDVKNFYKDEDHMTQYFMNYEGYNHRQIQRMTHIESYEYDIMLWIEKRVHSKLPQPIHIFYDYLGKDSMTGISHMSQVNL